MKTYIVDKEKSKITWKGKDEGSSHKGTMDFEEGKLFAEMGKLVEGVLTVDTNSIQVPDESDLPKEEGEKLIGHLKSKAFFDAKEHPHIKYKITSIEDKEDKSVVNGLVTLKDETHGMNLPAEITIKNGQLEAKAQFKIKSVNPDIKETITKNYKDGEVSTIDLDIEVVANAR